MHDPFDRWYWLCLGFGYIIFGIARLRRAYVGEKLDGSLIMPSILDRNPGRERMSTGRRAMLICLGILAVLVGLLGIWRVLSHWH